MPSVLPENALLFISATAIYFSPSIVVIVIAIVIASGVVVVAVAGVLLS